MTLMRFAAIALPETLRRSSLAKLLRRRANHFAQMLAQLSSTAYARLGNQATLWDCYSALMTYCGKLFPVWYPDFMTDDFESEDELGYTMDSMGIPVYPVGTQDGDFVYGRSAALSGVAYFLEGVTGRVSVAQLERNRMGEAWRRLRSLEPWHERQIERAMIKPPAGRKWRGRWESLPWLVKYIDHDTGFQWLDLCAEDMDEGGNPPWSIEDIRFLAHDWTEAERVWKPLKKFIAWLDAQPARRMPIVMGALTGDERVRLRISEPKRPGRTLAEVFDEENKTRGQRAHARRA